MILVKKRKDGDFLRESQEFQKKFLGCDFLK
jgi:hypothetical protein